MNRILFCFIVLLIQCSFSQSQSVEDSLIMKLESIQELGYLPGFAVAIVDQNGTIYEHGFGYRNVEEKKDFTVHSLQNIGSISKTLTGICLMKLSEEEKISLDDPINDYLSLNIHNPYHPEIPITIRHLATHTSTFNDPIEYEHTYIFPEKIKLATSDIPKALRKRVPMYNQNVSMPVEEFIYKMIHPFGEWYRKKNFLKNKPGTTYSYSNLGAALTGHIIELVTGKTYEEYTREIILDPLGMKATGWSHETVDISNFVGLYLSNDQRIPPYSLITYADGGLITNVHDLSLFFSKMIKGYMTGESEILDSASFQTMMNPAFTSEEKKTGIFWTINGKGEYGHSGGDPGIMTFMMFDPETGIGRIVFTNKFDDEGNGMNQLVYIWKTLEDYMYRMIDG